MYAWSWLPGIMITGCVHSFRHFKTRFSNSTLSEPRTCQKSPRNIIPAWVLKVVNLYLYHCMCILISYMRKVWKYTWHTKHTYIHPLTFRFTDSSWTCFKTISQVSMDELFTWRSEKIIHFLQAAWAFGGVMIFTTEEEESLLSSLIATGTLSDFREAMRRKFHKWVSIKNCNCNIQEFVLLQFSYTVSAIVESDFFRAAFMIRWLPVTAGDFRISPIALHW